MDSYSQLSSSLEARGFVACLLLFCYCRGGKGGGLIFGTDESRSTLAFWGGDTYLNPHRLTWATHSIEDNMPPNKVNIVFIA